MLRFSKLIKIGFLSTIVAIYREASFPPKQFVVLDFFLAHRAVPYVPCTSRYGEFYYMQGTITAGPSLGSHN